MKNKFVYTFLKNIFLCLSLFVTGNLYSENWKKMLWEIDRTDHYISENQLKEYHNLPKHTQKEAKIEYLKKLKQSGQLDISHKEHLSVFRFDGKSLVSKYFSRHSMFPGRKSSFKCLMMNSPGIGSSLTPITKINLFPGKHIIELGFYRLNSNNTYSESTNLLLFEFTSEPNRNYELYEDFPEVKGFTISAINGQTNIDFDENWSAVIVDTNTGKVVSRLVGTNNGYLFSKAKDNIEWIKPIRDDRYFICMKCKMKLKKYTLRDGRSYCSECSDLSSDNNTFKDFRDLLRNTDLSIVRDGIVAVYTQKIFDISVVIEVRNILKNLSFKIINKVASDIMITDTICWAMKYLALAKDGDSLSIIQNLSNNSVNEKITKYAQKAVKALKMVKL